MGWDEMCDALPFVFFFGGEGAIGGLRNAR